MLVRLSTIVGNATELEISQALHDLGHRDCIEYLVLDPGDMARRRLRTRTDRGTECAIALPREQRLANGSVLELNAERAIVVQLDELPTLLLTASDRSVALRLGFLAGHLHWRVEFEGERMRVSMDGPRETYLTRLAEHLDEGSYHVADPNAVGGE